MAAVDEDAELVHRSARTTRNGDDDEDAGLGAFVRGDMVQVLRSNRYALAQPLAELIRIQLFGSARVGRNQLARLGDIPAKLRIRSGHPERVDLTTIDRQLPDEAAAEALRTDRSEAGQDDGANDAGHSVECRATCVVVRALTRADPGRWCPRRVARFQLAVCAREARDGSCRWNSIEA
jgi:hypothetical protein